MLLKGKHEKSTAFHGTVKKKARKSNEAFPRHTHTSTLREKKAPISEVGYHFS